jgi:ribonuclease HI
LQTPANQSAAKNLSFVSICLKVGGGGNHAGIWAGVLRMGDHVRDLSGVERGLTANALLLRAATRALQTLTRPCSVTVYSDAEYLIKGAAQWCQGWQARNWQTKDGKPVANRTEWEALLAAAQPHHVTWQIAPPATAPADMERAAQVARDALEDAAV